MANEYIHYIKRGIVTSYPSDAASPWFSELQAYEDGFELPKFHVTRSKSWPVGEIREGDVIWLVGQLASPWGRLPPSIDAKVVVGSVEEEVLDDRKTKIRFLAKEGSRWFPLTDASRVLSQVSVLSKNGQRTIPYSHRRNNLGQAFQSIKRIDNPCPINAWASEVLGKHVEFISYRIADGTKAAFIKAEKQMRKGCTVFWDRWSLPRRLAERRELVSDAALDSLLLEQIQQSKLVWGIESPKYDEAGSYSQREKELADRLRKYEGVREE